MGDPSMGDPSTADAPASPYRFGGADFRGRRLAREGRRAAVLRPRLRGPLAVLIARRQSETMPTGIAAIPTAISPLATRSSDLISTAMTTRPSSRPQPNASSAVLV